MPPDEGIVDIVVATWRGLRDAVADPGVDVDPARAKIAFNRLWTRLVLDSHPESDVVSRTTDGSDHGDAA
ncbi:hypothetical protein [Nocardioides sp. Kera G14]|uniref:hypothetical protein n=1 Tax=Nocardioides sp. Kera G14 TaxID=2884264 RepID=UPI001D10D155|nr:hypothetical protein [Nocardioides sp. Kera G14]UDY24169.1 hypothetical protein LH076_02405 [Nocardioides sp. Kera G14]